MSSRFTPLTVLNCVMAACFVFSAAVQYNDPDPARWVAMYALAAVACALHVAGRRYWALPAAVGLIALAWAATLAPRVVGKVAFGELFEAFEMKDVRVEEAREMGGLLIVAAWMAALTFSSLGARGRVR
jgi:hypothetical protein